MSFLRQLLRPRSLILLAVTVAAIALIAVGLSAWIGDRTAIPIDLAGRTVTLLAPGWLYVACAVPLLFLLRTLSLTDLSVTQQVLTASLRGLVLVALAVALARPSWITYDRRVATVALVDVSDSISEPQLRAAEAYVEQLRRGRGDGSLQVVTFAEKPRVAPLGDGAIAFARHGANASPGTTADGGAGTDVQAAMQLAYGLFPDGHLPRLVILSDGNQTAGDLASEAYRARDLGIKVSWHATTAPAERELRVIGLTVPDEIKVGAPFEVQAEVWSTAPQTVTLALSQDEFPNPLDPSKTVTLTEGKNVIPFKSEAKRAGATTYRLRTTKLELDTERNNNESVVTAPVKGRPNVLYVEGGVMREPGSAGYLERALEHENIDVEVRGPRGLPGSSKELEKYDLVVLSDVPAHFVSANQLSALEVYVKQIGGGLIAAGGPDSFGSGGYQNSKLEQLLPVSFDSEKEREEPDVALMLVMDRSGSMAGAKIEAAKESARVTAEVLKPRDILGVVVFDSEAQVFVRPQRAANRMRISAEISRLQANGGTNIYPGLREAYELLQGINAKVKHVILLSDGESPYDGIVDLVQDMRAARITVSAVGVAGADRNLLSMITDNGDGRLYMVDDIGALPKIFTKETTEAQKAQLVEDLVSVRIAKRVEAIEGTAVESAPALFGYVSTKPKPTGEVILISDLGEPLLARWRQGAGTAVAWTSDVKNRWAANWVQWAGYPKFWAQVVRTSMRRKAFDSYELSAKVADGRAQVVVDAIDTSDKFVNELDTTLEIIDPKTNQTIRTVPMAQQAAGRYQADFKVERYGSFLLKAVHQRDGKTVAESTGAVSLPYPLEYLRTSPDPDALAHVATVTGGRSALPAAEAWAPAEESVPYTEDLWPYLLLAAAALFLLELFSRRVRLFGYRTVRFE